MIFRGDLKRLEKSSICLMICNQRDTLFENYRQLVERLSESVIGLKTGQRTAAFEALYQESEQIRRECEKARCAVDAHRREHGC
jgi:hypothetical protein